MNVSKGQYKHFGECLFADNGTVRAVFPLELGIRVISFSFIDGENVFFEQPEEMTDFLTHKSGWRVFGGARLWASPESDSNYYPDCEPVEYSVSGNTVTLTQRADGFTGFIKTLSFTLNDSGSQAGLEYSIENTAAEDRRFALWALTVMAPGGTQTVEFPRVTRDPFTPTQIIRLWEYTDLSDERVSFSIDRFTVKHNTTDKNGKIGFINPDGRVRYENNSVRFIRQFDRFDSSLQYSDGGINYETYICRYMNELEALSPLYTVKCGDKAVMTETWSLERC